MEECPICGGGSYCIAYAQGTSFDLWDAAQQKVVPTLVDSAVLCMRPPNVERDVTVNGYRAVGNEPGAKGGRFFVAASGGRAMSADEQERYRLKREADVLAAARKLELALFRGRQWWERAGEADPAPALAYLAARGVPVDRLPAGWMNDVVRYHPELDCFEGDRELTPGPAILLAATKPGGRFHTLHRIYLALDGKALW